MTIVDAIKNLGEILGVIEDTSGASRSIYLRSRILASFVILLEDIPTFMDAISNGMTHWFDTCQKIEQILERHAVPSEREMVVELRKLGRLYLRLVELHTIVKDQREEWQGAQRILGRSRVPLFVLDDALGDLPDFLYGPGRSLYLGVRVDFHPINSLNSFNLTL